jgi:hypothetical protein
MALKMKTNAAVQRKTSRLVLGGEGGTGKSTGLAAYAKKALYLDLDKRFPKNPALLAKTNFAELEQESYKGVKTYLNDILNEPKIENDMVVVDTGTKLLAYMEDFITTMEYDGKSEKYHAYGSGSKHLPKYIREITDLLEKIEAKHQVHVAIVLHTKYAPSKNPMGEDFLKNSLDLPTVDTINRIKHWADLVGFVYFEVEVDKDKHKAKGTRKRMVTFNDSPLHDAKNGSPFILPEKIAFDSEGKWAQLALEGCFPDNKALVQQIDAHIDSYPAGQKDEIRARFEVIGYRALDSKKLKEYLDAAIAAKGDKK